MLHTFWKNYNYKLLEKKLLILNIEESKTKTAHCSLDLVELYVYCWQLATPAKICLQQIFYN